MSESPIEFLGDQARRAVDHTEYGGDDGLIQSAIDPLGGEGHLLDSSEARGILARAGSKALSVASAYSGEVDALAGEVDGVVVDPVTGRIVPDEMNEDVTGTGGQFSDMGI